MTTGNASSVQRVVFVSPRFADGATTGGAETLLKAQAGDALAAGMDVEFLATCATNHFTWENELPAGVRNVNGLTVRTFPVDERDAGLFLSLQQRIDRHSRLSADEQQAWMQNSVNSTALCNYIRENESRIDRIVVGPYLFGLTREVASLYPERTVCVPCLHDEPFAYQETVIAPMFSESRCIAFNTPTERSLATRIFGAHCADMPVVGLGIPPFKADPGAFSEKNGLHTPYIIYSGRREPLKGTPLLFDYLLTFRERTARDIKLVMTGSGDVPAPAALAPHIIDLGFVPEQTKQEAMAGAAAFVHPSTLESLGIVLLESWLAGTPVIVHGQSPVLVDQCRLANGGLWFRHYADFEEILLGLLDEPLFGQALAESGRRFVLETYHPDRVRERLVEALLR